MNKKFLPKNFKNIATIVAIDDSIMDHYRIIKAVLPDGRTVNYAVKKTA